MGFLSSLLNNVKSLGAKALNGTKFLGNKVADIADSAKPFLSKIGLGSAADSVSNGARAVSGLANNIKMATDKLPSVGQFLPQSAKAFPMGAGSAS